MRKFKINLAVIALLLGSTVAFAATKKLNDPTHFKNANGDWELLIAQEGEGAGQYTCEVDDYICTGYFSIPMPAKNATPQSNARPGVYTLH